MSKVVFKFLPIRNMKLNLVTGGRAFGMRMHPIYKRLKLHEGIDITMPTGTPVYAVEDGKVQISKMQSNRKGYGNYIVIDHGDFDTISAHLSKRSVSVGQTVKAGQIIGHVGSTGDSTGAHLHFGLCYAFSKRDWFDPLDILKEVGKEEDEEVVKDIDIIVNGKSVKVEGIFKDNKNYVLLRDCDDKLGLGKVGYDSVRKMPTINR